MKDVQSQLVRWIRKHCTTSMGTLVCVVEKRFLVKKERNASPVIATNEETLVKFLFFKRLWKKALELVYVPSPSPLDP